MIGFAAANCNYVYNDLSHSTVEGARQINKFLGTNYNIIEGDARDFIIPFKCDGVFMCPPYYNLEHYEYNDHILGKIELWRANEIFKMNDLKEEKTKMVLLNIRYSDNTLNENIEGNYDLNNDKIIFDLSKNNMIVSVFNISEITFN